MTVPGGLGVGQHRLLVPRHRRKGPQVAFSQGLFMPPANAMALQALLAANLLNRQPDIGQMETWPESTSTHSQPILKNELEACRHSEHLR